MSTILGDPKAFFFTNPHPLFKRDDRVVITGRGDGFDGITGAVLHYLWCSPNNGDSYHVMLDGYACAVTFLSRDLRPEKNTPPPEGEK